MLKKEVRVIGFDDGPFDKFNDKEVLVVGTFFRGGHWLDGILSTRVTVDGDNATVKLIELINKSKFKPQTQFILLDGLAFGGFNIVDIESLNKYTNIPVVVVIRKYPNFKKIKETLINLKMDRKYALIEKAGNPLELKLKEGRIYFQFKGTTLEKAKRVLEITTTRSFLPEPVRVAHLIAAGVIEGESKGDA